MTAIDTLYPKKFTAIVPPALLRAFVRRCRAERVYGQGVIRTLAQLYANGKIEPAPCDPGKKPYKAWLTLKCDVLVAAKLKAKCEADKIQYGAAIRGLVNSFAHKWLPPILDRFVLSSAPFVLGRGGQGLKGKKPDHLRAPRKKKPSTMAAP